MRPWRRLGSERLCDCRVFDVDLVRYERPDRPVSESFYCIAAPDWINVIALNEADEVLLVRQFRFGLGDMTLEIPGGMCDGDEDPLAAARRELVEETGHAAREWTALGWVHPNPALQSNRCHTYLARGAHRVGELQPDEHEEIEVVAVALAEVPRLIREGRITHSLVIAAFHLLDAAR